MSKDKPRFIRKNGKVIPIGGKKKGGDNKTKKKKDWAGAEKTAGKIYNETRKQGDLFQKEKKQRKPFTATGVIAGGILGAAGGMKIGRGFGGIFGALVGIKAGGMAGRGIAKRTKKGRAIKKARMQSHRREASLQRKGERQVGSKNFGDVVGETFTTKSRSTGF